MLNLSFSKIFNAAERETGLHRAVDLLQQDTTDFDRLGSGGNGDGDDGAGNSSSGGNGGGSSSRVKFVVPEEPGIVSLRTAIRHVARPDPSLPAPAAPSSSSSRVGGGGVGRGATAPPPADILDAVRARAAQRVDPSALALAHITLSQAPCPPLKLLPESQLHALINVNTEQLAAAGR